MGRRLGSTPPAFAYSSKILTWTNPLPYRSSVAVPTELVDEALEQRRFQHGVDEDMGDHAWP